MEIKSNPIRLFYGHWQELKYFEKGNMKEALAYQISKQMKTLQVRQYGISSQVERWKQQNVSRNNI